MFSSPHNNSGDLPKQKNIWFLSEIYYPEETSTGYILTHICEGLAREYNIQIIAGPPSNNFQKKDFPSREVHNSVYIFRCGGSSFNKDSLVGRIFNILTRTIAISWQGIKRCKKDEILFAVTNPPSLPIVALLISRLKGNRYVLIVHDVYPDVLEVVNYKYSVPGLKLFWKQINRLAYFNAARIVVLGRDMYQRIEHGYLQKVSEQFKAYKLICIHNWAETQTVYPDQKENNPLLQALSLAEKFVVLYAGNLGHTHGVEIFAEAMKALRDVNTIHFLTIATGKKRPWLRQYIDKNNLKNASLVPLENRPRSEQNVSLNAGDVAIITFIRGMSGISVPSRMYNCMAAGKPIIAVADHDSELAQVIREEDIGWVIDPDDLEGLVNTIKFAASHPHVCEEMGQRAVKVARSKYTLERAISSYKALLEDLVEGPSSKANEP